MHAFTHALTCPHKHMYTSQTTPTQLVAEDPDTSFNAEVHYAVLTTEGPFTINTDTGAAYILSVTSP